MAEAVRGKGEPERRQNGANRGGGGIEYLPPFNHLHRTLNQIFTAAKYKVKTERLWPAPVVAVARRSPLS